MVAEAGPVVEYGPKEDAADWLGHVGAQYSVARCLNFLRAEFIAMKNFRR